MTSHTRSTLVFAQNAEGRFEESGRQTTRRRWGGSVLPDRSGPRVLQKVVERGSTWPAPGSMSAGLESFWLAANAVCGRLKNLADLSRGVRRSTLTKEAEVVAFLVVPCLHRHGTEGFASVGGRLFRKLESIRGMLEPEANPTPDGQKALSDALVALLELQAELGRQEPRALVRQGKHARRRAVLRNRAAQSTPLKACQHG